MRVAYQAGVLAALEQAGLRFHHVDGSSGGTMNLSMLLSGLDADEICQRWRTLRQRQFAAPLPWRDYWLAALAGARQRATACARRSSRTSGSTPR